MSLDPTPSDTTLRELARERLAQKAARRERAEARKADVPAAVRVTTRTALPDRFVGMNKWERRRAQELDALKRAGRIAGWWGGKMSGITLQLAFDTRYTPDFLIQDLDGSLRLEEVKGFWRDDAKVKTRVCASLYPFPIRVLVLTTAGWEITEVQGTATQTEGTA